MMLRRCASLTGMFFVAILAVGTSGCSGGSASTPPPPSQPATTGSPAISVSLSGAPAAVDEGATAQLTAMVANDGANKGVTWTVSCSAAACGGVSPSSTASGAPTTYTPPSSLANNLTVTLTAASVADATKSASLTITVPAISVSINPNTAIVQPGATGQFTATVNNDPANSEAVWAVTCSSPPCGSVSPTTTARGTATTYTAPSSIPQDGLKVTLTATAVNDTSKAASATIMIPGGPAAATVSGTIKVGTAPSAIAVNSATNKVYVAVGTEPSNPYLPCYRNPTGAAVTLIDGATDSPTAALTLPTALGGFSVVNPIAITLNPGNHTLYVVTMEFGVTFLDARDCFWVQDAVVAIDTSTFSATGIISQRRVGYFGPAGPGFLGIDVDQATGSIYLSDAGTFLPTVTNSVIVIGSSPATIPVGTKPAGVAVNATTNKIYVANSGSNDVSVIDGTTNSVVATITDPNAVAPVAVAVNPTTNTIYVANSQSNNVSVINGATNSVTATIASGTKPSAIDVDPQTNFVYVANAGNSQTVDAGNITVINGATNAATTLSDSNAKNPVAIAVNPLTNKIYVANSGSNNVTVIDGAHN